MSWLENAMAEHGEELACSDDFHVGPSFFDLVYLSDFDVYLLISFRPWDSSNQLRLLFSFKLSYRLFEIETPLNHY